MGIETLEPGEWGPFEELTAASAEILRLRSLLRWKNVDPDAAALVPDGHLVYQPQKAEETRGRAHRTVELDCRGQTVEVDAEIAPLLELVWRAGLETVNSCQDNPRGFVWIEFRSASDAGRFVDLATDAPAADGTFGLAQRALRQGPAGFWPLSRGLWLYKLLPLRGPDGKTELYVSVRFPRSDLEAVVERLRTDRAAGQG